MNPSVTQASRTARADEDLAEQARPGHGVPSQDPNPAAQMPLEPKESDREAKSVLTGGGAMVGVATGGAIGSVVAGPVGAVIGGTLGAVAGALGGAAAGTLVNPEQEPSAAKAVPEGKRAPAP